jgi:large subunit ribosomal protein L21
MASAIIETGGKQYRVEPGTVVAIEKLDQPAGSTISFERVLMVAEGEKVEIGTPVVAGAVVTAEVIEEFRGPKIRVATFKSKKRQRRVIGHRQDMTRIKVMSISGSAAAAPAKPKAEPKAKKAS